MKSLNRDKLNQIISNFKRVKILVVGDLILDEFIWGKVSRISPEAPVPVVWVSRESIMPGGSGNVANNVHSLGGTVYLSGVIGDDKNGERLMEELSKRGVETDGMIIDNQRPTVLKTRVIAHQQQVVRIDREKVGGVPDDILDKILTYTKEKMDEVNAVIIEDYGKGVITPRLLEEIVKLAGKKIIAVDPKESHFPFYKGVTSITPNHYEAEKAAGIEIKDERTLREVGERLLANLKCETVLITRGEDGMSLFESEGKVTHIPTVAQEVFDVSGAGDTVIGTYTLALGSGATFLEAAHIANCAAGIVVGKIGIAVATNEELKERIRKEMES